MQQAGGSRPCSGGCTATCRWRRPTSSRRAVSATMLFWESSRQSCLLYLLSSLSPATSSPLPPAGRTESAGWQLIRSRVVYLLVPYLVWSLLVFAADFAQGQRLSLAAYGRLLLTGRTTPAYYFIPLLIQLYLLSPLIVRAAKRNARALLLVTLLVVQLAVPHAGLPGHARRSRSAGPGRCCP
jgi:hypothetical protein